MLDTGFVDIFSNVSKNLAVLTCGVAVYCWLRRGPLDANNLRQLFTEAAILSVLVAYSMIEGSLDAPGLLRDARVILIALAVLFSGPLVGALVTAAVILVRIYIGGVGMSAGIFMALAVLGLCCVYRDWRRPADRPIRHLDLLLTAVLASMVAKSAWLFLPPGALFNQRIELALSLGNIIGLSVVGTLVIWDEKLKRLRVDLADDEAKFHAVIDNLPVSVAMRDRDGLMTLLNRRYRNIYGPEINRFLGRDRSELRDFLFEGETRTIHEADEKEVERSGRAITRYLPDMIINGRERSLLITTFGVFDAMGEPDRVAVIGVDVSELRNREKEMDQLQSHLLQSSKMKAMGQLAGGIAHDFNNLLGAISGFASFLSEDLAGRPADELHANRILALCDRARGLVEQVLAFARADRVDRQLIDVRQVLEQAQEFMRATLPTTTKLVFDADDGPIRLMANAGQINQLIVNLAIHASQSLDGRPGQVTVGMRRIRSTSNEVSTETDRTLNHYRFGAIQSGQDYVRIVVSDDGGGMDQYTMDHIMEPFFAIRGSQAVSGLGLSIVHGIVAAYGGAYVIRSAIDLGATFEIYLPVTSAALLAGQDAR